MMIKLPVYNTTGKQVETLAIDEALLGAEVRPGLLKQAYVMFHANRRQGSAKTRSRGMVDGSTRKIFRQKGTGNARMGTRRTGIRRGGGVIFAKSRTRADFRQRMPKKMRQLANRNALLAKLRRVPRWLRILRLLWLVKTRRCEAGRWAVFGMLPQYQRKGGTLVLVYDAIMRGKQRYSAGEISWTQDTNSDISRLVAKLGVVPYKRYRIYETRI